MRSLFLARLLALAVGASLAVAACAVGTPPAEPDQPTRLAGTQWAVVAVDTLTAPVPGREPTLLFGGATVSGTGGCNSFSGAYAYQPPSGAITFRDLSMTAMACLDQPLNDFERAFFEALSAADRLAGTDLQLVVSGRGHRLVLVPKARDVGPSGSRGGG